MTPTERAGPTLSPEIDTRSTAAAALLVGRLARLTQEEEEGRKRGCAKSKQGLPSINKRYQSRFEVAALGTRYFAATVMPMVMTTTTATGAARMTNGRTDGRVRKRLLASSAPLGRRSSARSPIMRSYLTRGRWRHRPRYLPLCDPAEFGV